MAIEIKVTPANITEGQILRIMCSGDNITNANDKLLHIYRGESGEPIEKLACTAGHLEGEKLVFTFDTTDHVAGTYTVHLHAQGASCKSKFPDDDNAHASFRIWARQEAGTNVTLQRSGAFRTKDQPLWTAIRNRTQAVSFERYRAFIDHVFACGKRRDVSSLLNAGPERHLMGSLGMQPPDIEPGGMHLSIQGPYAYSLLKLSTQVFLTLESGVVINRKDRWTGEDLFDQDQEALRLDDRSATVDALEKELQTYLGADGHLPYLKRIVRSVLDVLPKDDIPKSEVIAYCQGILQHRLTQPSMIELIWSYWHEEGMLAQTMNAIAFRFQNLRSSPKDPLGGLELDPLRPLNNIIWGYVQDRHNRLTIARRAFEYDHHYGVKLVGKAVPAMGSADSRSKFFEAFHNLLYRTAVFYREDAETTVVADAFPLLNALKDVHLLLAEGAHNQYGDLPWTARAEMLTEQWMLARPEMREFLRGRHMVPYQEGWMGAVDAMKKLQGWTDTTITHFNELAVDGERLLLSIRFGDWSDLNLTEDNAKNWARYWKPEVQRYIYGYLAVTGVDLMAETTDSRDAAIRNVQPSLLLQRRLAAQTRAPALAARPTVTRVGVGAAGFAALPAGLSPRALRQLKGQ